MTARRGRVRLAGRAILGDRAAMRIAVGVLLVVAGGCKQPARQHKPPVGHAGPPAITAGPDELAREDFAPGAGRAPAVDPAPVAAPAPCQAHDVELIYTVDHDANLASFDPRKLPGDPFHVVGKLGCDPASHPFSMAVDREGVAWVLYMSGDVYRVSILDARCSPAVYRYDARGPQVFGMGFVTDGPKATTEQLYVAAADDSKALARLDLSVTPPRYLPITAITMSATGGPPRMHPELTGTGDGRLFGYFPEEDLGFVQELDRASGKTIGRRLPLTATSGDVSAYAFAQWGGVFYVFATITGNSVVHAVNARTGEDDVVLDHLTHRIVGAGVSTCAPMVEQSPDRTPGTRRHG